MNTDKNKILAKNSVMTPQLLNGEELAHVLTYVYKSWGNEGDQVTEEEIKKVRKNIPADE